MEGKHLPLRIRPDGYVAAHLSLGGENKIVKVHRLVAIAFIDNQGNKPEVNHKNGIRHDNRVENLEWVTKSENVLHSYRELRRLPAATGKPGYNRKLTAEQVRAIRKDDRPFLQIANDYPVSAQTIWNVKNGIFYSDIV